MIGTPSLLKPYDEYYSGDPAFAQAPPLASREQLAEHEHRVKVARETGDWSPLAVEGVQPTKFTMKPLRGQQYRRIVDDLLASRIGRGEANSLAFRCAVLEIVNFGAFEMKFVETEKWGKIASVDVSNAIDAIDLRIVTELGEEALRRAQDISPKSSRD